eukprot:3679474-Rhodomonas_salina.1
MGGAIGADFKFDQADEAESEEQGMELGDATTERAARKAGKREGSGDWRREESVSVSVGQKRRTEKQGQERKELTVHKGKTGLRDRQNKGGWRMAVVAFKVGGAKGARRGKGERRSESVRE